MTPVIAPTTQMLVILSEPHINQLKSFIARHDKWMKLCKELSARDEETDPDGYKTAMDAWLKGRRNMPSKVAKHRAYDHAAWLLRYLPIEAPRAENVDGLRVIATLAADWRKSNA